MVCPTELAQCAKCWTASLPFARPVSAPRTKTGAAVLGGNLRRAKGQTAVQIRAFKKAALDVHFCDFSTLISTLAQQTE